MKHCLVTLAFVMILKDTATFQALFIVSLFCAWNITTVEINNGVHTHLKVKSVKCLCLLPMVLVLLFGLGLGLFTLVLVLRIWSCLHHCHEQCVLQRTLVTRCPVRKAHHKRIGQYFKFQGILKFVRRQLVASSMIVSKRPT